MDFKGFTGMSGRHPLERLLKSSKRPEGGGGRRGRKTGVDVGRYVVLSKVLGQLGKSHER